MDTGKEEKVGFWNSIRTKLIVVMIAVAAVPLLISVMVSYFNSTHKAVEDAEEINKAQCSAILNQFTTIIEKNMTALQSVAASVDVQNYVMQNADAPSDEELLVFISNVDKNMDDGNITVITGADGMQILRASGKLVDVSSREYFKKAMAGTLYVSDVIVSTSTGVRQITFAAPIYGPDGSTVIGIAQRNYDLNEMHKFLAAASSDAFVADRTGLVAAHAQYEITPDNEEDRSQSRFMTSGLSQETYLSTNTGKGYNAIVSYQKEPKTNWTICVAQNEATVYSQARRSAMVVVIIGVVMLIIAVFIAFSMARSFTKPVEAINSSLSELAEGRFQPVDGFDGRKDEFGIMVRSNNTVIGKLQAIVSDIKQSAVAVGASSGELADTSQQISQTADDVANAVQEIATGATQQADEIQSATQNIGNIEEAVSNVQESTGSLTALAGRMQSVSQESAHSLDDLRRSSENMSEAIVDISAKISATSQAVENINKKVEAITGIATQTNLLALNASIEAARAGDAGKGFAVVAEEIRQEMDVLLRESQAAVSMAGDVQKTNSEQQKVLAATVESVNMMIEDIAETVTGVQSISDNADSCVSAKDVVVDAMGSLSAISEENAASSQETGASMQELSATVTTLAGSANALRDISDKLNEEMAFFQ